MRTLTARGKADDVSRAPHSPLWRAYRPANLALLALPNHNCCDTRADCYDARDHRKTADCLAAVEAGKVEGWGRGKMRSALTGPMRGPRQVSRVHT
jgi:hypothetical protein